MFKPTEDERLTLSKAAMSKLQADIDVFIDHHGQWWFNTENVDERIYPKSKEDLENLFDLFVKPSEVKDVN